MKLGKEFVIEIAILFSLLTNLLGCTKIGSHVDVNQPSGEVPQEQPNPINEGHPTRLMPPVNVMGSGAGILKSENYTFYGNMGYAPQTNIGGDQFQSMGPSIIINSFAISERGRK